MNVQHLNHKHLAAEFLHAVTSRDFVPTQLALSDDSCWDEYETEYAEETLPNHVRCFFDEAACREVNA